MVGVRKVSSFNTETAMDYIEHRGGLIRIVAAQNGAPSPLFKTGINPLRLLNEHGQVQAPNVLLKCGDQSWITANGANVGGSPGTDITERILIGAGVDPALASTISQSPATDVKFGRKKDPFHHLNTWEAPPRHTMWRQNPHRSSSRLVTRLHAHHDREAISYVLNVLKSIDCPAWCSGIRLAQVFPTYKDAAHAHAHVESPSAGCVAAIWQRDLEFQIIDHYHPHRKVSPQVEGILLEAGWKSVPRNLTRNYGKLFNRKPQPATKDLVFRIGDNFNSSFDDWSM